MKHISLFWFLFSASVSVLAQENVIDTNYYTLPVQRLLKADPDDNRSRQQTRHDRSEGLYKNDLFGQLRETQTWYINLEGGFRSDVSTLSNSLNGLVKNATQTKPAGSILLGYTYRNAWAIEAGYTWAPIHLNITIANGSTPLIYDYQNSGYGIPLRLKRRIGSGKQAAQGTGFWFTAGAWLVPNGSRQMDDFRLIGYSYRSRGSRTDTLRLTNTTTTTNAVTGLAEAGFDYAARLSPFIELGAYVRKYWGLGDALRSELIYTVNNTAEQQAIIKANGTGWGFGITLRYIYGRQHEPKRLL